MGYTTYFSGAITFDRPINKNLVKYINDFSKTRHMKRNVDKIKEHYPDWMNYCFDGMNLGKDGEFFVSRDNSYDNLTVVNYNDPPGNCPGLWCNWMVDADGYLLRWNEAEKFYNYVEWLEYIFENFIIPSGYVGNGVICWSGEDESDRGEIHVNNNKISAQGM